MSLLERLFRIPDRRWVDQPWPQLEIWTDRSVLDAVLLSDLGIDFETMPLTRAGAMRVPAMARARNLTCGTIAGLPLLAMRAAEQVTPQPYWAYGTDGQLGTLTSEQRRRWCALPQAPQHRMLWTIDDLLFHGESLWLVTDRLATDYPSRMIRIPYPDWDVIDGQLVDQDGEPYPPEHVVWIPGANEGVLTYGGATLRMAYDLEKNARDVAMRPLRLEAHQTSNAELTPDERKEITSELRKNLADNNGILFTNSAVELKTHTMASDALQLGARNASAVDVARLANMPAMMLDATSQGASLEYQTMTGRNQQWLDYGLSLFMDAVEARLSMDDIVPAGQRIAFDTTDWTAADAADTGYPTED